MTKPPTHRETHRETELKLALPARRVPAFERAAPVPVAPVRLPGEASVEDGLVALCTACLAQFQANLPGVLEDEDIEYVHQARVALQRLRVALRLYRGLCPLPPGELLAGLRALAGALGPVRDWDVLCCVTLPEIAPALDDPPAWRQLMRVVQARRRAARQAMQGAIVQAGPAAWLRAFHRWLAQRAWRSEPARQAAWQAPLQPWAARALQAGHKKLVRSARDFARQSPQQRHALRLRVKRQRYATEFFETLPGAAPHAKYRGHLHELQSSLGRANDAHIARALLGGALAGGPGAGGAGQARGAGCFVLGWLARQAVEPADPGVLKALKFIRKSRPAW